MFLAPLRSTRALIALALIAALAASFGCASEPAASTEPAEEVEVAAEEPAAPDFEGRELSMFVAAGMKKPMDTIIAEFQENTGAVVLVNYGSSGELYAQIEAGQPCDLYYSADWLYIEKIQELDKVSLDLKFLSDSVVLAVSPTGATKITSLDDLTKEDVSLVIGDPAAPVGAYAEAGLKSLGLWDALEKNLKARPSTVNQVAIMVKEDQVDAGMVYSSVANGNDLQIVETLSQEDTGEIIFGAAILTEGDQELSKAFMDYASERVAEFEKYGWKAYE